MTTETVASLASASVFQCFFFTLSPNENTRSRRISKSPNEMDVSDEYIRGEREVIHLPSFHFISKRKRVSDNYIWVGREWNTYSVLSLYLQIKICFRQLYLSWTRVKYIFHRFIQPQTNIHSVQIHPRRKKGICIPSFHLSPNEKVCFWLLYLSPTRLENVPRPFTLSPNENIYVSDECIWDQIERNIIMSRSVNLSIKKKEDFPINQCLRLKSDMSFGYEHQFFTPRLETFWRDPGSRESSTALLSTPGMRIMSCIKLSSGNILCGRISPKTSD